MATFTKRNYIKPMLLFVPPMVVVFLSLISTLDTILNASGLQFAVSNSIVYSSTSLNLESFFGGTETLLLPSFPYLFSSAGLVISGLVPSDFIFVSFVMSVFILCLTGFTLIPVSVLACFVCIKFLNRLYLIAITTSSFAFSKKRFVFALDIFRDSFISALHTIRAMAIFFRFVFMKIGKRFCLIASNAGFKFQSHINTPEIIVSYLARRGKIYEL